jgi:inosine-uridine nucleoside N-ribohydrolase
MVPLDATHQALVSLAECETLRALNGAAGKGAAELIAFRISGYEANQPTGVPKTAPVHDALCIAALVDPSIIKTIFANVVVETKGEFTMGRTVVDLERRTTRGPNCHVAMAADRTRFFEFMKATLSLSS